MSAHTPGPWLMGTDERRIENEGGTIIANVSGSISNPAVLADARLIAAAPELLTALKLAVRQNSHDMLMTGEELRQCEAAIAKAEGR